MTRQFSSIQRISYSALAFALAATATSPVWAQATDDKPALETVVVVAQKREQAAQDVPIALSVFSAAALDRAQIEDATDLQYSIPNAAMVEAVQMLARTEGILLDPVYTGKIMAGLIGLAREGYFKPSEQVLFLHTGGLPSLHAYEDVVLGRVEV